VSASDAPRHHVDDVSGRAHPPRGRPAAGVPLAGGPDEGVREAVQHAVVGESRADRAIDGLATPQDVAAWLAACRDRRGAPGAGDLSAAEVRALRELLQTGFAVVASGRRPANAFIRRLSRLSRGAPQHVELRWPRSAGPGVHVRARSRTSGATALAAVARSAIELLGGPGRSRLRRCDGPRCVLFFLASDPRQTWCSGVYGYRARMARYPASRRGRRRGRPRGPGACRHDHHPVQDQRRLRRFA
jgi:predicted RNA-binding Zn ribbon-like protein